MIHKHSAFQFNNESSTYSILKSTVLLSPHSYLIYLMSVSDIFHACGWILIFKTMIVLKYRVYRHVNNPNSPYSAVHTSMAANSLLRRRARIMLAIEMSPPSAASRLNLGFWIWPGMRRFQTSDRLIKLRLCMYCNVMKTNQKITNHLKIGMWLILHVYSIYMVCMKWVGLFHILL